MMEGRKQEIEVLWSEYSFIELISRISATETLFKQNDGLLKMTLVKNTNIKVK